MENRENFIEIDPFQDPLEMWDTIKDLTIEETITKIHNLKPAKDLDYYVEIKNGFKTINKF